MKLDAPSVNVEKRSNEQNIQNLKSWANNTVNELTYYINALEARVSALEQEVSNLRKG